MSRVVLVQAAPRIAASGAIQPVRVAGGGSRAYTHLGYTDWLDGVTNEPLFSAQLGFDKDGWTSTAVPQTAAIGIATPSAQRAAGLAALVWSQAAILVQTGDDVSPNPNWRTRLAGKVAGMSSKGGVLSLTIADLSAALAQPVCPTPYAGTGGLEGGASLTGQVKRRSWGRVFNVEGVVADSANNIYEFGDPAYPLSAFVSVKDRGRAGPTTLVPWAGTAAATLAALVAATPPSGGASIAPSIARVKWWTQPAGPLTADLLGEIDAGYVETGPEIAAALANAIVAIPVEGLAIAAALRPEPVGCHIANATETAAAAMLRVLLGVSMIWTISATGALQLLPIGYDNPVELVDFVSVERTESYPPVKAVKIGYAPNNRIQSDGEISAAVLAGDVTGLGPLALAPFAQLGTTIVDSTGAVIGDSAVITKLGTAAAISGQGAFATMNTAAFGSPYLTGFGALAPLGSINLGGTYLYRQDGSTRLTDSNVVTALGTASAISGQGAFATVNSAAYGSSLLTGFGALAPLASILLGGAYLFRADGSTKVTDATAITSLGTASGIAGQGAFATVNSAAYGSSLLTGFGALAPLASILLGGSYLFRADGSTKVTDAIAITSLGTASGIAGQGAFATVNSAAYGSALLTGFGALAPLASLALGGSYLFRQDGSTKLTDSSVVTSLGTASAIAGQGAFATLSSAAYGSSLLTGFGGLAARSTVGGGNLLANSTAAQGTTGFAQTNLASYAASTDRGIDDGLSFKLTATQSGADTYLYQRYANPLPSTTYTLSGWAYLASAPTGAPTNNRSVLIFDGNVSAEVAGISAATATGKWQRFTVTFTTSASPSFVECRWYCPNGTIYWDNLQLEVGDTATQWQPRLSQDDATRGADAASNIIDGTNGIVPRANLLTSLGTAAAISGQGSFATLSSAAYGSSLLTGFGALSPLGSISLGQTYIRRADGSTILTDALAVTSLGTAAAIAGQGYYATGTDFANMTGTTRPANNAGTSTPPITDTSSVYTATGNTVTKTGAAGWTGTFFIPTPLTGASRIQCRPTVSASSNPVTSFNFGFSGDPTGGQTAGFGGSSIYGVGISTDQSQNFYTVSPAGIATTSVTYSTGDVVTVDLQGTTVTLYRTTTGGVTTTIGTVSTGGSLPSQFYAKFKQYGNGDAFRDIAVTNQNDPYWSSVIGAGRPANNADVTSANTAAAFTGQARLATLNQVTLNTTTILRADGSTVVSETLVVTTLGTAAAIAGQSPFATFGATTPGALLAPTANLIVDSTFRFGGLGWSFGAGFQTAQSATDSNAYLYNPGNNGTTVATGPSLPVLANFSYCLQGEMAYFGSSASISIDVQWTDTSGKVTFSNRLQLGPSGVIAGTDVPGRNSNYATLFATVTSPANAASARVRCFTEGGNGNSYWRRLKLGLGSNPTIWSDEATTSARYGSDGTLLDNLRPATIAADKTGNATAAGISGQGPAATLPVVTDLVYLTDTNTYTGSGPAGSGSASGGSGGSAGGSGGQIP